MKRIVILLALCALGCTPGEVKEEVHANALRCARFTALVNEGTTTREQEQAFIAANGEAWKALDEYFQK